MSCIDKIIMHAIRHDYEYSHMMYFSCIKFNVSRGNMNKYTFAMGYLNNLHFSVG